MNEKFEERIEKAKTLLCASDCVIIGGGSGLSSAAGLTYSGDRFKDNFTDFIDRYKMTDMYTAGFYPFESEENKWAYWSRHIFLNRYLPTALPLYKQLYDLVKNKDYFVITTNVDYQFHKSGFSPERIFAAQGDYGKFQCANGCHDALYDNERTITQMKDEQQDCRIPSYLVPKCPVCGENMEVHIRKDTHFVQNADWDKAYAKYCEFASKAEGKRTVLLELGVGFNTPTIIRFPFEQMTYQNEQTHLIRLNADYSEAIKENAAKTVSFAEAMTQVVSLLQ